MKDTESKLRAVSDARFRRIAPDDYHTAVSALDFVILQIAKHPAGCLSSVRAEVETAARILDRAD